MVGSRTAFDAAKLRGLKGLTIGDARVTVGLRRSGQNVVVDIYDQEGSVNVLANGLTSKRRWRSRLLQRGA